MPAIAAALNDTESRLVQRPRPMLPLLPAGNITPPAAPAAARVIADVAVTATSRCCCRGCCALPVSAVAVSTWWGSGRQRPPTVTVALAPTPALAFAPPGCTAAAAAANLRVPRDRGPQACCCCSCCCSSCCCCWLTKPDETMLRTISSCAATAAIAPDDVSGLRPSLIVPKPWPGRPCPAAPWLLL